MVSYQRKWQILKIALGKCSCCGKRKIYKSKYCRICYKKVITYQRKYQWKDREKQKIRMAKWRRENPNYQKLYYRKNKD